MIITRCTRHMCCDFLLNGAGGAQLSEVGVQIQMQVHQMLSKLFVLYLERKRNVCS